MRLFFFFVLTGYTYVFKPGGIGSAWGNKGAFRRGVQTSGWGEDLKNSIVFTWGFVEVLCWFWVSDSWKSPVAGVFLEWRG